MQILLDMTKPWLGKVGALFIQKEDASFRHTLFYRDNVTSNFVGRSTVAHFARKVRGAKIVAAQHGLKIQQSHVRYVFVALTLRAK